jgi:hypothetical protein
MSGNYSYKETLQNEIPTRRFILLLAKMSSLARLLFPCSLKLEPPVSRQCMTEHITQRTSSHATYNMLEDDPQCGTLKTA